MNYIGRYYSKKLENIIKYDRALAEAMVEDNNNINELVMTDNILKTLKLVIIIVNISYFVGFGFLILSELQTDYDNYFDEKASSENSLLDYYEIK